MSMESIAVLGVILIIGGFILVTMGRNRGGALGRPMYVLGRWGIIAGFLCALPVLAGLFK